MKLFNIFTLIFSIIALGTGFSAFSERYTVTKKNPTDKKTKIKKSDKQLALDREQTISQNYRLLKASLKRLTERISQGFLGDDDKQPTGGTKKLIAHIEERVKIFKLMNAVKKSSKYEKIIKTAEKVIKKTQT